MNTSFIHGHVILYFYYVDNIRIRFEIHMISDNRIICSMSWINRITKYRTLRIEMKKVGRLNQIKNKNKQDAKEAFPHSICVLMSIVQIKIRQLDDQYFLCRNSHTISSHQLTTILFLIHFHYFRVISHMSISNTYLHSIRWFHWLL